MSIDLEKAYFKKLEKYVGKKLNIVSNKSEITVIYDVVYVNRKFGQPLIEN